MASNKLTSTSLFTISLLLLLNFSPSLASHHFKSSIFGSTRALCNNTPYPEFCYNSLPHDKPGNINDFGRIAISQSLSHAKRFLRLVQVMLKLSSRFFTSSIGALEDCKLLAQLNVDSLSQTSNTVNYTNSLQSLQASDLQTLLSATLTNLDTCLDGLKASRARSPNVFDTLLAPLLNGTKHYSVSLALFTHGWVPAKKKGRSLTERVHMFSGPKNKIDHENIWDFIDKRSLLQLNDTSTNDSTSAISAPIIRAGVVVSQIAVVNRKGRGANFTTITDAVNAAPNNTDVSNGYFVIYIMKGEYNEYVSIPKYKQYIMMIGDDIGQTVITGNRSVDDGWTTFNSATFAVVGQGFVAINITFRNTAGAMKHQAVAVRNGADMSTFYKCGFEGYQDTLYTHSLRQFYRDCEIYGTIDYIFGNAAVVFQNCKILSRLPLSGQFNTITAQGRTDPNQNTGTSIHNCSIKAAKDLASSNVTVKTYLGRPWKEYSRTVFMQSSISSLIDPSGWAPWSGDFALTTLYYAEFNNTGAGSKTDNRVTWPGFHVLNATDARNFTVYNLTQGDFWLNTTGVLYSSSLM